MDDTIAAIATGIGPCGIGIIRVSGEGALAVGNAVFRSAAGLSVEEFRSHAVHYGELKDPCSGEVIDRVLLTVFRAPRSYTGEDVVEISCHGGMVTMRRVLEAVLRAGARLAEPGEFTRRAFLNGRMDLAQAEAVNDLIRAQTDAARRIAMAQLEGKLSRDVRKLTDELMGLLAEIEASFDFPEDIDEPARCDAIQRLNSVAEELSRLIDTFSCGRVYREGIRVVIAGRPNVGKSSLLNALLGEARAIVTPIPGTTRDAIEETVNIRGIPVVAVDTAGLRESSDAVEKIGVELAQKRIEAADLVIFVLDISAGVTTEDLKLLEQLKSKPFIIAANKVDLLPREAHAIPPVPDGIVVYVSALTGEGMDSLASAIESLVLAGGVSFESAVLSNARHREALVQALECVRQAMRAIEVGEPLDIASGELMAARENLGMITGESATEDLLDRIFSEFCIGK